jgi:arsenical pump membrane protein
VTDTEAAPRLVSGLVLGRVLAAVGLVAALVAVLGDPAAARAAALQVWSPFVLVAGLLLVGLVADGDGLFAAGGHALARLAPNGTALFAGMSLLVVVVTTVLNLDTSVTFLTPVLVSAARSRGEGEAALLIGCLALSNAGSLLLPGSNLTNLIVSGHLHRSGGSFLAHMLVPGLGATLVTAVVIGALHHRELRATAAPSGGAPRPVLGVGMAAVAAVALLVIVLRQPALPVLAVGVVATAVRSLRSAGSAVPRRAVEVLGVPVLVALFGMAVALGTLGRVWTGPATLLSHLGAWGTAYVAAGASVLVDNLPAASLLAARRPPHPFSLLVGLDVGPNLFVTGSLAWVLWLRAARRAGADPSVRRAVLLGVVSAPLAIAVAVGLLVLSGSS